MTDYARLLRTLSDANVDFIVVGGVAATVHGSPAELELLEEEQRKHRS